MFTPEVDKPLFRTLSSFPPVVCRRVYVIFMLWLFANSGVQHVLTIRVKWWVSYKRQELLTRREHLGSPPVFDGFRLEQIQLYSFLQKKVPFVFCFIVKNIIYNGLNKFGIWRSIYKDYFEPNLVAFTFMQISMPDL